MTKGRDLPSYIHRRKRDGVLLFRKRIGGKIHEVRLETQFPEGQPVPFALHQERERLLNAPRPVAPGKDLSAVIRAYRAAPKYADLKPRTRDDYEKHLPYFAEKMGHLAPRQIERHHIIRWRDAWSADHSPHFSNYRLRVFSILMEQAKDMGLLTKAEENPAKGIPALKYEKRERKPWPETKVAAFRKAYQYGTRERTLFELCLGTGQRIGDVLKMQWGHIDCDEIRVLQGKTGKPLWLPITPHLAAALEATERRGLFILSKDMRKAKRPGMWAYRGAADAMRAARDAIGATEYDLHALRYTAAVELLLAGCDDDQIAAVTGQSPAMVRHYTRHVRQRVRAREAQERRS
jgi:integrase